MTWRRHGWFRTRPASQSHPGCAAGIAAFKPGPTAGIFAAAAALLTVGAVWATKELQSAARLLFGAVAIALGAPVFVLGAAFIAAMPSWMGQR
jgi:hypothetical protein